MAATGIWEVAAGERKYDDVAGPVFRPGAVAAIDFRDPLKRVDHPKLTPTAGASVDSATAISYIYAVWGNSGASWLWHVVGPSQADRI